MKPVAIFRHSPTEGPGHFATFLEAQGIAWRLIAVDEGEPLPAAHECSGLAFMGGPMSVNDPLPWVEPTCSLIREAVRADIPVIGHCLGGQLMSKALGGQVTRNPCKEIGWGTIEFVAGESTSHWLDSLADMQHAEVFHWHGETFSIPDGATRIAGNKYCANQMFALGPHLAMQCHVEMTPAMIACWCEAWHDEVKSLADRSPGIQSPEEMCAEIADKLPAMRNLAQQLYGVWIRSLKVS